MITLPGLEAEPLSPEFVAGLRGFVSPAPLDAVLLWISKTYLGLDTRRTSVRWPALIYGILTLLLFWKTLTLLSKNPVFHWAGVSLASMDVVLRYYAAEVRPYSLWALLSTLQLYCFTRLLTRDPVRRSYGVLLPLSLTNVLLLQTSTGALFQVILATAVILVTLAMRGPRPERYWYLFAPALTILLPILLAGCWIYHSATLYYPAGSWTGSFWGDVLLCARVVYGTTGGGWGPSNMARWTLLGLAFAWSWRQGRESHWLDRPETPFLLLFIANMLGSVFICMGDLVHHYLICQRQLIYLAPYACLTAAWPALGSFKYRITVVVGVLCFVLWNAYHFHAGWTL